MMKIDKSKALILFSVVAIVAILSSPLLAVYASANDEENNIHPQGPYRYRFALTDEQREMLNQKIQ